MEDLNIKEVALRIRLLREDLDLTMQEMADATGRSVAEYAAQESGDQDLSFTFRYKTLGNYGFSVLLAGIPESLNVEDYGGGTRNIFSAGTDDETGKDVLYVVNPAGGTTAVADFLKPDTDYTV